MTNKSNTLLRKHRPASVAALPGKTTPVELLRVRHRMGALLCLRDHGSMSRIELCERLGYSATTMTKVIGELVSLAWVREGDALATQEMGRPRTALHLQAQRSHVLVMLVEPTSLTTALVGLDLVSQPQRRRVITFKGLNTARTIDALRSAADQELKLAASEGCHVDALVVVAPGITDAQLRASRRAHQLGWRDLQVADLLEPKLGLPVIVHNNTRAMALAEFRHLGLGENEPLLFVQARWGLGAALVNSGVPSRHGHYGVAELGHIPLGINGFTQDVPTDCQFVSVLSEAYLRAVLNLPETMVGPVVPKLEAAAARGEARAKKLLKQTLENLATALGVAIDMLNPSVVVLGGIYADSTDAFIERLHQRLTANAQPELVAGLRLQRTALGIDAALQGGAIVAFDRLLNQAQTYHSRQA